jgi:hypothetical protein
MSFSSFSEIILAFNHGNFPTTIKMNIIVSEAKILPSVSISTNNPSLPQFSQHNPLSHLYKNQKLFGSLVNVCQAESVS